MRDVLNMMRHLIVAFESERPPLHAEEAVVGTALEGDFPTGLCGTGWGSVGWQARVGPPLVPDQAEVGGAWQTPRQGADRREAPPAQSPKILCGCKREGRPCAEQPDGLS